MPIALPDMKMTEVEDSLRQREYREIATDLNVLSEPIATRQAVGCFALRLQTTPFMLNISPGIIQNELIRETSLNFSDAWKNSTDKEITVFVEALFVYPVGSDGIGGSYRMAGPLSVSVSFPVYDTPPDFTDTDGLVRVRVALGILRLPQTPQEEEAAVNGIYLDAGTGIDPITLPPLGGRD